MRYSEKQKAEFRSKFAQKKQTQMALLVPLGGAVFMLLRAERHASELRVQPQTMALGTAGLLLAAAAFYWLNWRCPACKKYLGTGLDPSHCPKCRVELRSP